MNEDIISGLTKHSSDPDSADSADSSSKSAEPKGIRHIDDGSDRSVSSRESIRNQLRAEVEQFLKSGGTVQKIEPHVTADPPTKPISNYGGRPI